MKKIISFSLWGSNPKYTYGAIENARLAKTIYPGWIARFYCGTDVHPSIISALKDEEAEVIIVNEANDNRGMFWRFYAASDKDCSLVIFRDTDSRLTIREAEAVEQWVQSSRSGHIMRDHPYHDMPIMGGMWGCRGDIFPDMYDLIREFSAIDKKNQDQLFLQKKIYPILIEKGVYVHDDFFCYEKNARPFPSPRMNYHFVGEIINESNEREHHWIEIKKYKYSLFYRLRFLMYKTKLKLKLKIFGYTYV